MREPGEQENFLGSVQNQAGPKSWSRKESAIPISKLITQLDDSLNLSVLQDSKIYKESQNVQDQAHEKNIDESDLMNISGLSMMLLEKNKEPKKTMGANFQKNLDSQSQEEAWCGKGECNLM